jgi:four helix bundle protein
MKNKTHKDLDVWQYSMDLVQDVYEQTRALPAEETYGLKAQMRRAAVSIPSNIAEGSVRGRGLNFARYLYQSLGSLSELETQLFISQNIYGFKIDKLLSDIERVRKLLFGLIKYAKTTGNMMATGPQVDGRTAESEDCLQDV